MDTVEYYSAVKKKELAMHITRESPGNSVEWKQPISKDYICIRFLEWQISRDREQVSGCQRWGVEWAWLSKGSTRHCLYLDSSGGHKNYTSDKTAVKTHTHTHTSALKLVKFWIRFVDCIIVNFLVVILCYSYVRCYHSLGERCKGSLHYFLQLHVYL